MAISLTFNSVVLCAPSNGKDGYRRIENGRRHVNYVEAVPVDTSGRIMIVVGRGQTDETCAKVEFECEKYFASDSALASFEETVEGLVADTARPLGTLQYGNLNGTQTITMENCRMDYRGGRPLRHGDGSWWLPFRLTFNQWGTGA